MVLYFLCYKGIFLEYRNYLSVWKTTFVYKLFSRNNGFQPVDKIYEFIPKYQLGVIVAHRVLELDKPKPNDSSSLIMQQDRHVLLVSCTSRENCEMCDLLFSISVKITCGTNQMDNPAMIVWLHVFPKLLINHIEQKLVC